MSNPYTASAGSLSLLLTLLLLGCGQKGPLYLPEPEVEVEEVEEIEAETLDESILEEALEEREQLLETIADGIPLPIVIARLSQPEVLFVNELAPRPHNSGHWTLDARSSPAE